MVSSASYSMTEEQALATAEKYDLEEEVQYLIDKGFSPLEALEYWDII